MAKRTTKRLAKKQAKRTATKTATTPPPTGQQAGIPGIAPAPSADGATPAQATQALAAEAKRLADAGRHVPHHLAQALRQAWLADMDQHVWPSSTACAAELGVTQQSLRNWTKDGFPLVKHSPIPKAPAYRWLYERERARVARAAAAGAADPDLDDRLKAAKLERLEGTLLAEADDHARQAILSTIATLKHRLRHDLPGLVLGALDHAEGPEREDCIRRAVERVLTAVAHQHRPEESTP